jgi:hypothetical protein
MLHFLIIKKVNHREERFMGKNQDGVWGAKASAEVCEMLDDLFEQFNERFDKKATKKEYLEHLARLDKTNQIRSGTDTSLSPELLKLSSGDLTELTAYTDGIG